MSKNLDEQLREANLIVKWVDERTLQIVLPPDQYSAAERREILASMRAWWVRYWGLN